MPGLKPRLLQSHIHCLRLFQEETVTTADIQDLSSPRQQSFKQGQIARDVGLPFGSPPIDSFYRRNISIGLKIRIHSLLCQTRADEDEPALLTLLKPQEFVLEVKCLPNSVFWSAPQRGQGTSTALIFASVFKAVGIRPPAKAEHTTNFISVGPETFLVDVGVLLLVHRNKQS